MENVKAIIQKKFMPHFQTWMGWLEEQGYVNFWQVLNAKNYGIPQNRERVFMISIRRDGCTPTYNFPSSMPLEKRLKDMLETEVDERFYLKQEQVDRIVAHCDRKVAEGCGFKTNFVDGGGISGTIKTKEGSREYDTYVKEVPPIDGINTAADNIARTIKANYYKTSAANFERQDGRSATGVIEEIN